MIFYLRAEIPDLMRGNMITFELRTRIVLFINDEEELDLQEPKLPRDKLLKRRVTIPLSFVPTQLDLEFDNLRCEFHVEATRWDEKEEILIVFAKEQQWQRDSFNRHLGGLQNQGYMFIDV
jgi:hypothetical protein